LSGFAIKDSGERQQFASGMVRDTQGGKTDYWRALDGPMFERWAEHLTKGAVKYPDVAPLVPNWTLAEGAEEIARFKASALRHFLQWFRGETDEDHAAAVFFNINGAEHVKARQVAEQIPAGFAKALEHGEGFGVVLAEQSKTRR
jgi:hypothetical protein